MFQKVLTQAQSLAAAKAEFEVTLINNLQQVERRLNASQEILSNHISVSPILLHCKKQHSNQFDILNFHTH